MSNWHKSLHLHLNPLQQSLATKERHVKMSLRKTAHWQSTSSPPQIPSHGRSGQQSWNSLLLLLCCWALLCCAVLRTVVSCVVLCFTVCCVVLSLGWPLWLRVRISSHFMLYEHQTEAVNAFSRKRNSHFTIKYIFLVYAPKKVHQESPATASTIKTFIWIRHLNFEWWAESTDKIVMLKAASLFPNLYEPSFHAWCTSNRII